MSKGQMTQNERRAREAIGALGGGDPVFVGKYKTSYGGGSITSTLAKEYCRHHEIGVSEEQEEYFDYETGALIILPVRGGGHDG